MMRLAQLSLLLLLPTADSEVPAVAGLAPDDSRVAYSEVEADKDDRLALFRVASSIPGSIFRAPLRGGEAATPPVSEEAPSAVPAVVPLVVEAKSGWFGG